MHGWSAREVAGSPMIIGIDYTAGIWQGAGIGRYTRELVRAAVAQSAPEPQSKPLRYVLFYAAGGLPADSPYVRDLGDLCARYPAVRAVPLPLSPRLLTILWQRARLPLHVERFTGPLDLLHAPDFVLPPTRAPGLLTVHDLTFLVHPECFEPRLHRYLARVVPRSLRRARHVLADSHATQRDLTRLLGVPAERISVVYPGVDPRFCPLPANTSEPVRARLELPPAFLLFVGTLEPRKNLVRLLEALHRLPDAPPLVLAGRRGWLYQPVFETIERLNLQTRVHWLDFVADTDLPALYNLAEAFLYPSLYEGFGLPVAEALACGTPVVTSALGSLPEVAGDAAILADPLDSAAIAAGIQHALTHGAELRAAGPAQVRQFRWDTAAQNVLASYRMVGSEQNERHGTR
jgi:glycosyltransferase involved in cell wall biosynthesis